MTRRSWLALTAALSGPAMAAAAPAAISPTARATYATHCAACHGAAMGGSPMAPALTGPEFTFGWKDKSVDDLSAFIKGNMPPGRIGSLADQQYHDLAVLLHDAGAK